MREGDTMAQEVPQECGEMAYDVTQVWRQLKTQKAKGMVALIGSNSYLPAVNKPYNIRVIPYNCVPSFGAREMFARPCPIIPRHGFVESRPVRSYQEVVKVFEEARAEDPQAELILMPKLSGKYSGVATQAGVTWGMGNDGVTGGKGKTVLLPTPVTTVEGWNSCITHSYYYTFNSPIINDTAYIELVEDDGKMVAVQLRDGPPQPTSKNYIPKKVVAETVLSPTSYDDSLLAWEERLKAYRWQPGLVVHLRDMALSSHYAVHAITLGMPVVTDRLVYKGDVLLPEETTIRPLTHAKLKSLAKMVRGWLRKDYIGHSHLSARAVAATSIASIHASPQWGGDKLLLKFRAMALVSLARFLCAAVMGEVRHWDGTGPGQYGAKPTSILPDICNYTDPRTILYNHALSPRVTLSQMINYYSSTYKDFNTSGWGGVEKRRAVSSFGGKNWARVSRAALRYGKALEMFLEAPNYDTWNEVMLAANNAIHTAHNNGYVLNKWLSGEAFGLIADAPGIGFMNAFAARMALGLELKQGGDECHDDRAEREGETR